MSYLFNKLPTLAEVPERSEMDPNVTNQIEGAVGGNNSETQNIDLARLCLVQETRMNAMQELLNQLVVNQVILPGNPVNAPQRGQCPILRKEHLDLIPVFNGSVEVLNDFLDVTQNLHNHFYNSQDPNDFQNYVLITGIKSRIVPPASHQVLSANLATYQEIRTALLSTYQDKRDDLTLIIELTAMKQYDRESPFEFHDRIQKHLNLIIAYSKTHDVDNTDVMVAHYKALALRCFLLKLTEPMGSLLRTRAPKDLGTALSWLTNDYQTFGSRPKSQLTSYQGKTSNQTQQVKSGTPQNFRPNSQNFVKNHQQTPQQRQSAPFNKNPPTQSSPNQTVRPQTNQNFTKTPTTQMRNNQPQGTPMSWRTSNFNNLEGNNENCQDPDPENGNSGEEQYEVQYPETPEEQSETEAHFLEDISLNSLNLS